MVPTVDTVRYNYLVSTMVASQNPVLLVGPVGTGKTSIAQSVLQSLPSSQWSVLTVNMSAQVCGRTRGQVASSCSLPVSAPLWEPSARCTCLSNLGFLFWDPSIHSVPFPPDHVQ